jgi:hypothetical protein
MKRRVAILFVKKFTAPVHVENTIAMKKIVLVLLLATFVCAGCATRYNIALTNGDVITARGKPKFDQAKGGFYYKDGQGNPAYISGGRVREVAPASMSNESQFLSMH